MSPSVDKTMLPANPLLRECCSRRRRHPECRRFAGRAFLPCGGLPESVFALAPKRPRPGAELVRRSVFIDSLTAACSKPLCILQFWPPGILPASPSRPNRSGSKTRFQSW